MTNASVALIDTVYWPIVQLSVSALFVRMPARLFSADNWVTRSRTFERSLTVYRALGVSRWKKWLPDAASLVGGTAKRVNPYHSADTSRFLVEVRRAELAHWVQLAFAPPCWLWNPHWAFIIMLLYAIGANVPCIVAQRYNRILLQRRFRQH